MDRTGRTNETWLLELRRGGAIQESALRDLREALVGGLKRGLASWSRLDDSLVEDAVQDAMVRILDRLEQFEGRSQFLTWATSVAIRVALSELRRLRWKDVSFEEITTGGILNAENIVDGPAEPNVQWERKAILVKMQAVIEHELTEKQRTALMAELRGMPQDEIARHLGSNRNAVYKLTHDARKRLKKALQAAGYEAADVHAAFF